MREIKFRGWDKTTEKMIYDLGEYVGDSLLNYLVCQFDDMTIGIMREGDGELLSVMQYTGLKDRNGKEIYEGDILLLTNGITVPVYYDSGAFWSGAVLLLTEDKSSVVIGNKWENPELDPDQ